MFVLYTTLFVKHGGSAFKTEAFQIVTVMGCCADSKQKCVC